MGLYKEMVNLNEDGTNQHHFNKNRSRVIKTTRTWDQYIIQAVNYNVEAGVGNAVEIPVDDVMDNMTTTICLKLIYYKRRGG